tara:strand:+ start:214 stop:663 length:450 start_codon:yes stop_codon:yes gene_type:complete
MAAVDSPYKDPSKTFVWWIEGDRLAIATSEGDVNTTETSEGKLKPVQLGSGNTVTGGLIISYNAEPAKLTSITGTIDVDNVLQPALIDYVKAKALMDAASREDNPQIAQIRMAAAQQSLASYREALRKFGMKKNDKIGGTRAIVPSNIR